ncbi:D-alpha-D-mannose-1-phosphate guanylyltransferase manB [Mycobacterium tuberculosis '98-R604 INH-RIF-EM']|nr:D-alpha-D-mannose-1-phosphate guanylyltransferase manB [Mycobacterium tuberculosis '98-R604 INH-RIF-EM']
MATHQVDAVVLVGGKGTRLRPLTLSAPKPMLPTAGLPFLTHLLSRIAAAGIEHVILGTSYKPAVFEAEFGDGSALGLQIEYVTEEHPLGTGGGIANVAGKLRNDTAMVFNGDVLSGADLAQLLDFHRSNRADVTLQLVRVGDPRAFGCVPTDEEDRVVAFLEKTEDPPTDQINAGCYVFEPQRHRPDSAGPGGFGGTRGVPGLARRRRLQDLRLCRCQLLAGHGHTGRLRSRIGGSGARHRPVSGLAWSPR